MCEIWKHKLHNSCAEERNEYQQNNWRISDPPPRWCISHASRLWRKSQHILQSATSTPCALWRKQYNAPMLKHQSQYQSRQGIFLYWTTTCGAVESNIPEKILKMLHINWVIQIHQAILESLCPSHTESPTPPSRSNLIVKNFPAECFEMCLKFRKVITLICNEHWKRQEMFSLSLLSDTPQRSPGLIRHYCVYTRAPKRVHTCEDKPNVQASNQARYHARVLRYHARFLHCFPDPLLAWTFYSSSDSLSTELQGHCIARASPASTGFARGAFLTTS